MLKEPTMKSSTLLLKTTALVALISSSLFIQQVTAAPGAIATSPLQASASAQPNIMFNLDTSGSMNIILADTFTHSYTCTHASAKLAAGTEVDLDINASDDPEIINRDDSDETRPLGNNASSYCFDPDEDYIARLDDTTGSYGYVTYKGDYLNWYFDTSTDDPSGANWSNYKPGAETRLTVAKRALSDVLGTIVKSNVGFSTFNGSDGADIDVILRDLDNAQLTSINTEITNATGSGRTPLAESLRDIGRYFANGDGNNGSTDKTCGGLAGTNLMLHPNDTALNKSVLCTTVLNATNNDIDGGATETNGLSGPIGNFCEQNFVVMLTDGLPGNDTDIHSDLKDYDNDCPDPADPDAYTCGSNDTKSYDSGPDSDYWDDVAQALFEIDLRPDLDKQDGTEKLNNIRTYTIGFADKATQDSQLIKDTGTQGGGFSTFSANSSELATAFKNIRDDIDSQSGTAAAVTFNSSTLSSQSAVYQALFDTQRWSGQLLSFPLDGFSGDVLNNCTLGSNNCWAAEKMLENQTSRTILTYNPDTNHGVSFAYNASSADYTTITSASTGDVIPVALVEDLCASPDKPYPCNASTAADSPAGSLAANKTYMIELMDYLRGDRTNESTTKFRIRGNKLGDIVNSSPIYVGKPGLSWPSTAPFPTLTSSTYSTWTTTGKLTDGTTNVKDRMPIVYVAANDGMLHGFRSEETVSGTSADAGEEVIAFVPTGTFNSANNKGLHYLAQQSYTHQFYVDLNPALSDVYINHRNTSSGTPTTTKDWRTVLVGGQGAGGNTMFMMDVTDPATFSQANAKQLIEWEFSQPDLGYTYSKPTIAMMNNGRFAAIFGSGYNSSDFGGDCKAKLFVVFLDGGIDGTWTLGTDPTQASTDYMVFDTTTGTNGDCNGLSTPAVVDLNGDRVADKAYAGDLWGNLWSFDLCNWDTGTEACVTTDSSSWHINATPIMTTKDDGGGSAKRQPITVKPVISLDPSIAGEDNLIIAFGTGQYLVNGDVANTDVQTFYGVRHKSARTDDGSFGLDPRSNPDKFNEQTITEQACTQAGCTGDVRVISNASMGSTDNGWFIDFNFNDTSSNSVAGERIVVNPKIRNNTLFFNTVIPDARTCYAGGNGWLMSVNLANGGRPLKPVFDLNNDGVFDSNDQEGSTNPAGQKVFSIPAESTFLGDNQYTPDSEGNISKRKVNITKNQREGRMSWKELFEGE